MFKIIIDHRDIVLGSVNLQQFQHYAKAKSSSCFSKNAITEFVYSGCTALHSIVSIIKFCDDVHHMMISMQNVCYFVNPMRFIMDLYWESAIASSCCRRA
jgi:hypothetical protein